MEPVVNNAGHLNILLKGCVLILIAVLLMIWNTTDFLIRKELFSALQVISWPLHLIRLEYMRLLILMEAAGSGLM